MVTAAVVVFLVLVVASTPAGTGFNFLVVVPGLAILILGVPWSVLVIILAVGDRLGGGPAGAILAFVALAVLNVVLHGALVRRERRRDARSS